MTTLTPSQERALEECEKLLGDFKVVVIKGEARVGKYTVVKELIARRNYPVVNFDLTTLGSSKDRELSNQHLTLYLQQLVGKLHDLSELQNRKIIYIRNYNLVNDILTDCNSKLRFFLPLIMKNFFETLPVNFHVVITTTGCLLPEGFHWTLELGTTKEDMECILRREVNLSEKDVENILRMTKPVAVGRVLYCLRFARSNLSGSFTTDYFKALTKVAGSALDIEKEVVKPDLEQDLIGVEDILDAIHTAIILPMRLNLPGLSIKKGLVICGPPGTGKTSIGRYLAHQIKGKFYLIGGEITGSDMIEAICRSIKQACENSPAVIFIDDCDVLFSSDDVYRSFLTLLDGVETKKRNDICFVLTCMDLKTVPAPLLRGGRLEMVLFTRLPARERIIVILEKALSKMCRVLESYDVELADVVKRLIYPGLVKDISSHMTGWNCADIHRCVNDVTRVIVAKKITNVRELFESSAGQISGQYLLCGKCDSTDLDKETGSYFS